MTKKSLYPRVKRITFSVLEKKYFDRPAFNLEDGGTTLTTPMSTVAWKFYSPVNAIIQGIDRDMRIGNKIFVRYIQLTFGFASDGDNTLSGSTCRYILLHNRQANLTIPTAADVFANGAVSTNADYTSLRNCNTLKKYSLLLDRAHLLIPATRSGDGTAAAHFNFLGQGVLQHYIPINKWVQYQASSSAITTSVNLVSNDFVIGVAPSNANCCIGTVMARVCYNDA